MPVFISISGTIGKNHRRVLEINKHHICFVLSNDRGFDPLLVHLNKLGLACTRIDSLPPVGVNLSPQEEAGYRRAAETLAKMRKQQRPHSRRSVIGLIAANFPRRPTVMQVNAVLARLIKKKLLYFHEDDTVTYG